MILLRRRASFRQKGDVLGGFCSYLHDPPPNLRVSAMHLSPLFTGTVPYTNALYAFRSNSTFSAVTRAWHLVVTLDKTMSSRSNN